MVAWPAGPLPVSTAIPPYEGVKKIAETGYQPEVGEGLLHLLALLPDQKQANDIKNLQKGL